MKKAGDLARYAAKSPASNPRAPMKKRWRVFLRSGTAVEIGGLWR
jgi:hypothetical protein